MSAILVEVDEKSKSNLRMFLLDLIEAKIPNLDKAILLKPELRSIFTSEQIAHYSSKVTTARRTLKPCWHGLPDTMSNYIPSIYFSENNLVVCRKSEASESSFGAEADFEYRPY